MLAATEIKIQPYILKHRAEKTTEDKPCVFKESEIDLEEGYHYLSLSVYTYLFDYTPPSLPRQTQGGLTKTKLTSFKLKNLKAIYIIQTS